MARSTKKIDKRSPKKPQPKSPKRPAMKVSTDDQGGMSILDGKMKNIFREAFLKRP